MTPNPHPMQPVVKDEQGVLRFRENTIIRDIVDRLVDLVDARTGKLDVAKIATNYCQEDRDQFDQLRGAIPGARTNAIVRHVVDHAASMIARHHMHAGRLDLNTLYVMNFPQEDREQFAQLMGYSISGYHELSYVSDESAAQASALAHEVMPGAGGCRDAGCPIHGGPLDYDDGRSLV